MKSEADPVSPGPRIEILLPESATGPSHEMRLANIIRFMPTRNPTITDVAKLCNVTPATVSRVLNGKANFSASQRVREDILRTAREIGYVPDLSARNLRRQKTKIIGIFSSPQTHLSEGINESLIDGLTSVLHPAGYDVFLELTPQQKLARTLPAWRFDGGVLMQAPKQQTLDELDSRRVPYVCINEQLGNPIASILADDAMGMREAVSHLAAMGHRKIAYLGTPVYYFPHYSAPERLESLKTLCHELGLALAPISERSYDQPEIYLRDEFIPATVKSGKATAVITYDHRLAIMLMSAADAMGLQIPADFSLVCFNDVFPTALVHPPLTTVAVAGQEMGRLGAEILLKALTSSKSPTRREIRVPEKLVIRSTTAAPRESR
jgi:LacI family transcriptional regulator